MLRVVKVNKQELFTLKTAFWLTRKQQLLTLEADFSANTFQKPSF